MLPFNLHLNYIGKRITIKDEDREPLTKDFDRIRDYVLDIMRSTDVAFNQICKGHSLFGSYANNVRIGSPNEFDVHVVLSFPFSSCIDIYKDYDRPGFVKLDFSQVMEELEDINGYDDVYTLLKDDLVDYNNDFLRRSNVQRWFGNVLDDALNEYGTRVTGVWGDLYELEYSKRGLAHTIYAHGTRHNISIDFIPAIAFGAADWINVRSQWPFKYKCARWYAVPKPAQGPRQSKCHAFMICCPKAEHRLLLNKQNLKVVYRLLKSLRNKYGLNRLKSYFLTTIFLWEIEKQPESFWHQSLSVLFLHMLRELYHYFLAEELPFFWDDELDLLDILSEEEIEEYTDQLRRAYNTLSSYLYQMNLSCDRSCTHFELTN